MGRQEENSPSDETIKGAWGRHDGATCGQGVRGSSFEVLNRHLGKQLTGEALGSAHFEFSESKNFFFFFF